MVAMDQPLQQEPDVEGMEDRIVEISLPMNVKKETMRQKRTIQCQLQLQFLSQNQEMMDVKVGTK